MRDQTPRSYQSPPTTEIVLGVHKIGEKETILSTSTTGGRGSLVHHDNTRLRGAGAQVSISVVHGRIEKLAATDQDGDSDHVVSGYIIVSAESIAVSPTN